VLVTHQIIFFVYNNTLVNFISNYKIPLWFKEVPAAFFCCNLRIWCNNYGMPWNQSNLSYWLSNVLATNKQSTQLKPNNCTTLKELLKRISTPSTKHHLSSCFHCIAIVASGATTNTFKGLPKTLHKNSDIILKKITKNFYL
jgi:hypothetical protein